ncbi:hypothetical protein ACTHRH_06320 [Paenibacillus sp. SAFN-117]
MTANRKRRAPLGNIETENTDRYRHELYGNGVDQAMITYSKWLIRVAVVFSVMGALLGSDMAGRKDYSFIPVHSHILVVGWLSLFAYGIFYYVFPEPQKLKLAKVQAILSMLGAMLLPLGMLLYNKAYNGFTTGLFIGGGTILLIGMLLFAFLVFFDKQLFTKKN